jgi:CheY-like chemotaxis protein
MSRILLVEDDEAVRAFVCRALLLDGHDVVDACDGEEGFDALQACLPKKDGAPAFDLLLTDIKMPFMDGIELTGHANKLFPDMPVIMMTGYADQRERADDLNVIEIVAKPFTLADIRASVSAVLRPEMKAAG